MATKKTTAQRITLGIDLGGTKILALAVEEGGEVVGRAKEKTSVDGGIEGIAVQLKRAADAALANAGRTWDEVRGVGIAVPGAVHPDTGAVLHAPALGWRNVPARKVFSGVFGRDVAVENDVNAGTLAEYKLGAARGSDTVVGYFVGTGLGGGVIVNGQLHRGRTGVAGELGHEIVRYKGRMCGCGHRGCIEAYCSKTAFCKQFRKLILKKGKKSVLTEIVRDPSFRNIRSSELKKAFKRGDSVTRKVLRKGALMLGVATANLCAILAPDCVVYGGGVMEALGDALMEWVREGFAAHLFGITPDAVRLELSQLGDDAVPLGAAVAAGLSPKVPSRVRSG